MRPCASMIGDSVDRDIDEAAVLADALGLEVFDALASRDPGHELGFFGEPLRAGTAS